MSDKQIIKMSEIEVKKLELMMTWENQPIVNRNLDNIIADFEFMNQNVQYEVDEITDELRLNLSNEKTKYINSHICGLITGITPESNFNKNHVTEDGGTVEEAEQKKKSEEFKSSLIL